MGMRDATKQQVQTAMGARGREIDLGLHFISNYSEGTKFGSGLVNFIFSTDGKVSIITALLDIPNGARRVEFIWNHETLPGGCSDLPQSRMHRCNP